MRKHDGKKVIYLLESPSGKIYIGQTVNFVDRWAEHKRRAKKGSGTYLAKALRKYEFNFKHKILLCDLSKDEADYWEKELIREFDTQNPKIGYNNTIGGDGSTGHRRTEEMKIKDRLNLAKGRANIGPMSEENREIAKTTLINNGHTPEARKKAQAANTGKKRSAAIRAKLSAAQKLAKVGTYVPESHIYKINEARKTSVVAVHLESGVRTEYTSKQDAYRATGVLPDHIRQYLSGKVKSAKGYHFEEVQS